MLYVLFYFTNVFEYLLENIAMSKEVARAAWNSTYEKGLVDVLHDYNPKLKGQNGWNSEGWRCITAKFNERFSLAHFHKTTTTREGERT
jgi:hypothetical protein